MTTPLLTYELAKRQIMRRHLEQLRDFDLDEEPPSTPSTRYTELVKWTQDSQTQINTAIKNREPRSQKYYGKLRLTSNLTSRSLWRWPWLENRLQQCFLCIYGEHRYVFEVEISHLATSRKLILFIRNNTLVLRAVQTYRLGNDIEGAFSLLEASVTEIDRIVRAWLSYIASELYIDPFAFALRLRCGEWNSLWSVVSTIQRRLSLRSSLVPDLVDKSPDGHKLLVGPFCGAFSPKDFSKPFIGIAFKVTTS